MSAFFCPTTDMREIQILMPSGKRLPVFAPVLAPGGGISRVSTLPTLHLLIARPDHIGTGRASRCTTRSCGRCGSGKSAFRSGKIIGYDVNIFVDFVRESSTFGFILAREGPLYRGDPEGGARAGGKRRFKIRAQSRRGNKEGCVDDRSGQTGKRQGGKGALFRQVQHGPCGFTLAGPFWPNKANRRFWPNKANGRFARPNNGLEPGRAGFPSGTVRHPLSRIAGTA